MGTDGVADSRQSPLCFNKSVEVVEKFREDGNTQTRKAHQNFDFSSQVEGMWEVANERPVPRKLDEKWSRL